MAYSPNNNDPQVLAQFLKVNCDAGKYGLQYVDDSRTLIRIIWKKHSTETRHVFEMFTEWSRKSIRKRGGCESKVLKETHGEQKHRFSNALKKAAGLELVEEDVGYRIYRLKGTQNNITDEMDPELLDALTKPQEPLTQDDDNLQQLLTGGNPSNQSLSFKISYNQKEKISNVLPLTCSGFRLFYGVNVIKQSQDLLGVTNEEDQINCYGPSNYLQCSMPNPDIDDGNMEKFDKILQNMKRGLVIYLGQIDSRCPFPNVYAVRLSQARIYVYGSNADDHENLGKEGLHRQTKTLIFDAAKFVRDFVQWHNGIQPKPSDKINFTFGQRSSPGRKPALVTMEMCVTFAKDKLDANAISLDPEISISNSLDKKANELENIVINVTEQMQIDDRIVSS